MKKILLFVILLLSLLGGYSQLNGINTITGKVLDSASGTPLEYATVTLFLKGQSKPVDGGTTDKKGTYIITDIKDSVFNIVFEFIGYNASTMEGVVVDKNINLKTILLGRKTGELQSVTVVGQGKLIENKIDKMVFNAERDLTSQSGVATDVL